MKKYIFKTTATMKPYNNKNWWIDGGIIPVKHIEAETVKDALQVGYVITGKQNFKRIPGNGLHSILIYGLKLLPLWKQSFERGLYYD